jgi:hypothetical protein
LQIILLSNSKTNSVIFIFIVQFLKSINTLEGQRYVTYLTINN